MAENLPFLEGNLRNHFREYLLFGGTEFNHRACLELLVSLDKNNAKTGKLSDYLSKSISSGVIAASAIAGGPGGVAIGKGVGKFSGEVIGELVSAIEKNKLHSASKRIEKTLQAFDPEDPDWIRFMLDCLSEIYIW